MKVLIVNANYKLILRVKLNCRTTAKKKSRRTADTFPRAYETAALIFRAAVSLRLHKPNDDLQGHGSRLEVILPCPFLFFAVSMICTS